MTKMYVVYRREEGAESCGDNVVLSFVSDAQRFVIHYSVSGIVRGNYPHVGSAAREGLAVLYRICGGTGAWMPLDILAKDYHAAVNMSHILREGESSEFLIYGPILARLEALSVEMGGKDSFRRIPRDWDSARRRLLFLGGRKTFGLGVTSTAMMFSNILRREEGNAARRISFAGGNFLEGIYGRLTQGMELSDYDVVVLEADEASQSADAVEDYLGKILALLDGCRHVILWHAMPDSAGERKKLAAELVERAGASGDWVFRDFDMIFSEGYRDMCTYSAKYINDAGNVLIYRLLSQEIKRCLWNT